jgi:hypothetical protein
VKLEFFPEGEAGQLHEIDDFSAVCFYDLVYDGQSLQFVVDDGKLVLWT